MSHPRTRSMFASSKASVTGSPADILDAMLASQAAAARARVEFPEPDWDSFVMEPVELDTPVSDPAEDTELAPDDYPMTERQRTTADHFEEHDWERALGREEGDE